MRSVVSDLLGSRPTTVDHSGADDLPERLATHLSGMAEIGAAEVRMREEGHVYFGEAFIVPVAGADVPALVDRAVREGLELDWRVQDVVVMPVSDLHPGGAPDAGDRTQD